MFAPRPESFTRSPQCIHDIEFNTVRHPSPTMQIEQQFHRALWGSVNVCPFALRADPQVYAVLCAIAYVFYRCRGEEALRCTRRIPYSGSGGEPNALGMGWLF